MAEKEFDWVQCEVVRGSKGLEIWVKADKRVEDFMESLSAGSTSPLEAYDRAWVSADPTKSIDVYSLNKPIPSIGYTIDNVCGHMMTGKGMVNLSFLRFKGISSPEGVRFIVNTPYQKDEAKLLAKNILLSSRQFFMDYIAPFKIVLRISSQEI